MAGSILTLDDWNKQATKEICAGEDRDSARNVRRARSGGLAMFTLWDDYLQACAQRGMTPESERPGM